jgi:adenylate cyclase
MDTSPAPARPRILVVDDEPAILAIVRQLLQDHYDVRFATGGVRALELAATAPPDLILLDVDMADLDGYTTCERLKALAVCADVPVIFLTARATVQDEERGFAAGAVDYILKPLSPSVLRARVHTQLQLRQAIETARAEQRKADAMLNLVLPGVAADELRRSGTLAPRRVDDAVVLFADVVGFTRWCGDRPPEEVVAALQRLFTAYEGIVHRHGLEKLKTIGDGFMAAANVLTPQPDALMAAVRCGLEMAALIGTVEPSWQLRVGVHSGPVVAGIVGSERFQFDIWGDTVNLAARLTGTASPGTVCMTAELHPRIAAQVRSVDAGRRPLKGKGDVHVVEVVALAPA